MGWSKSKLVFSNEKLPIKANIKQCFNDKLHFICSDISNPKFTFIMEHLAEIRIICGKQDYKIWRLIVYTPKRTSGSTLIFYLEGGIWKDFDGHEITRDHIKQICDYMQKYIRIGGSYFIKFETITENQKSCF